MGFGRHEKVVLDCPFCGKSKVVAWHKEDFRQAKTSRISAGAKTTYHKVPESYEILNGCSACGKSEKEILRAFETGITKELSHEERLKRLREAGLPTKIVSKKGLK